MHAFWTVLVLEYNVKICVWFLNHIEIKAFFFTCQSIVYVLGTVIDRVSGDPHVHLVYLGLLSCFLINAVVASHVAVWWDDVTPVIFDSYLWFVCIYIYISTYIHLTITHGRDFLTYLLLCLKKHNAMKLSCPCGEGPGGKNYNSKNWEQPLQTAEEIKRNLSPTTPKRWILQQPERA